MVSGAVGERKGAHHGGAGVVTDVPGRGSRYGSTTYHICTGAGCTPSCVLTQEQYYGGLDPDAPPLLLLLLRDV